MGNKKKVLVFIPEFPVLTETFIERELAKLVERDNVDLIVFSIKKGNGFLSDNLESRVFYGRLTKYDISKSIFYMLSHPIKTIDLLLFLKRDKYKSGSEKSSQSIFYLLLKSFGYAQKIVKFKPDIILSHFLSSPSTIIMCVSKITNIPYGVSAHAKDVTVNSEYALEKVKTAKFITICNKNAYDYLMKLTGESNVGKIVLSYHGVDVKKIEKSIDSTNSRKNTKPLILSIGRFVEKKGLLYLIEASKILKERRLEHLVQIIGSGPMYENLKRHIEELGVEDTVEILGNNKGFSNKETLTYLSMSDIYVFPSIQTDEGDVDGIANVLLEAGIFSIPVVSTDSGSTCELIKNGVTGIVVKQKDSKELANSIEILLNNSGLRKMVGDNLHLEVLNRFELDKRIVDLESLLVADY